jgi:hypothetical protein
MNALTTLSETQYLESSESSALTIELAKVLALVAPTSMTGEQQEMWLRAAVDALKGIRASEVSAVSDELRRKVTRPAQIVPEIAELISQHRKRPTGGPITDPCNCGKGTRARSRSDVHWIRVDEKRTEIGWCP